MPKTAAKPSFLWEEAATKNGARRVAGLDEVGRGPLAGPVTAAAVWLDPDNIPEGLNDSKKLSKGRRELLFDQLMEVADVSIAHASVREIEEINILRASHLAMRRAVDGLSKRPDHLLIDGNQMPNELNTRHDLIVRGDAKVLSIAAASIMAKVARDRIMTALDAEFPGYGWATNAGYPTPEHKSALLRLGVTPHHRRSFKPVHNMLYG